MKSIKGNLNKRIFIAFCSILLVVATFFFVYTGRDYGYQARNAMYLSAEFCGKYKIAGGEWQPYVKGEHIPANKGDVTLKGYFQMYVPDTHEIVGKVEEGIDLAFYFNHIGGEISEGGEEFRPFDAEYGTADDDMCGEMYIGYICKGADEVTIRLKNPHKFGNPYAVDDFLNNLSTYGGTDFERDTLNSGSLNRIWGSTLMLFAFLILGVAISSMFIRVKDIENLWFVGFSILFAGIYFIFKAHGVMFFSKIIKFNTRMLSGSIMLYMLSITTCIAYQFKGRAKKIGISMVVFGLISISSFMLAPLFCDIKFYDTLPVWAIFQSLICVVIISVLVYYVVKGNKSEKLYSLFAMLPMVAFLTDVFGTGFGLWQGGIVSEDVFILVFVASFILLLKIVPKNLNATIRAKELETEKMILKAELAERLLVI